MSAQVSKIVHCHRNSYAYVGNDPVNAADPSGRCRVFLGAPGASGLNWPEACRQFNRGFDSVLEAYDHFLQHFINLNSSDSATRRRAIAINRALGIAAEFFNKNKVETLELFAQGVRENPAYAVGRIAGSVALAGGLTRLLNAGRTAGAVVSIGNFTTSQVGTAIGAMDRLFQNIEARGLNPSLLSRRAVANIFYAAASGIELDLDADSGTVSVVVGRRGSRIGRRIEICQFDDEGQCK